MAGETDIVKLIVRLRAETGEMKRELQDAKGTISSFASQAKKLLGAVGIGLGIRELVTQVKDLVKWGVEYNSQIEQQVLGIGSLIAATGNVLDSEGKRLEGMEKLNAATGIARDLYDQLRIKAMQTTATTPELVEAFQLMVAPGREANLTLEQMVNLSTDIVQAMKAMGLPLIQSRMEMRGLLTGEENLRMDIMQRLQIEGETIKKMRDQGKLYDYLSERLNIFRLAGEKQLTTYEGMKSSLRDILGMLAAKITAPLFTYIKDIMGDVINSLVDVQGNTIKFKSSLDGLVSGIKNTFTIILEHFRVFKDEYSGLLQLVGMLFKGLNQAIMGLFTGISVIMSSATTVVYYFIKALDVLTGGSIPALAEGAEVLKKKMDESWDSTIKQADALNELIFGAKQYAEETRKVPKATAPPTIGGMSAEQKKKEEEAYKDLTKKLEEYRVSLVKLEDPTKADRMALEDFIKEKTKDVVLTPRMVRTTNELRVELEKLQQAMREKQAREDYLEAFQKITEESKKYQIQLLQLQDPMKASEAEMEATINKILEGVAPTAALSGAIDQLKRSFQALKEEQKAREAIKQQEAEINRQLADTQAMEKQFKITKEASLKSQIDLSNKLLTIYEKQLQDVQVGTERYGELQQKIFETRQTINDLTFDLDRQTMSFARLQELGIKKYAQSLKDQLVNTLENIVPNAIDKFGDSLSRLWDNLTEGTMSAKEAINAFFNDFAKGIMKSIIELGIMYLKMQMVKALNMGEGTTGTTGTTGTGGGWIGTIIGLIGGLFAEGGLIRKGSGTRDDVPILAGRGEFIQPEDSVRYYGSGIMEALRQRAIPKDLLQGFAMKKAFSPAFAFQAGGLVREGNAAAGPGGTPLTIVNVIDPREMDKYLSSAAGQNSVLNVMSSRVTTIRKILK